MKITIIRKINPLKDTHFFNVSVNGSHLSSHAFKLDEPEESIYNETKAYNEALELLNRIEKAGTHEASETTVFEKEISTSPEIPSFEEIEAEQKDFEAFLKENYTSCAPSYPDRYLAKNNNYPMLTKDQIMQAYCKENIH